MSTTNGYAMFVDMVPLRSLAPYVERLRALPNVKDARLEGPQQLGPDDDALLELEMVDGTTALFIVEAKRSHLTNELGERLALLRRDIPNLLLLAPLVGRDQAERFARA